MLLSANLGYTNGIIIIIIINAVVDAEPEGFVNGLGLHLGSGWLLFVGIITEFDFRFNL